MYSLIRKACLGAVMTTSLLTPVIAADLPARVQAPIPAPIFTSYNWSGFYVGVNAGYAFGGSDKANTIGTPGFVGLGPTIVPGSLSVGGDGFMGGGQVGFNFQTGSLVFGVEADLQYADVKGGSTFIGVPVLGTRLATSADTSMNYFGTVRGRFGFAIDRALIYATGGLAFADTELRTRVAGVDAPGLVWGGSSSSTRTGWTLGGGIEYAMTNNWTVKGEYLYYDLGNVTSVAAGNAAVRAVPALNGIDYAAKARMTGSIVRLGLNYKFGGSAMPVVAKY